MKIKFLLIPLLLLPSLGGKLFSEETMHSWTDTQGRTLQASFVSLTGTTLTIRMNGEDFPLDLSYFDSASQALAKKLASPPTPPAVPKPAPATPKPKPSPPKGELSLALALGIILLITSMAINLIVTYKKYTFKDKYYGK